MTDESISETPPCLSKTTRGIQQTGNPSAGQSVIGPITDAKEAQPILTAEPKTDNPPRNRKPRRAHRRPPRPPARKL